MSKSTKKWLIILGVFVVFVWGMVSGIRHIFKMKAPYRYQEEGSLIDHNSKVVRVLPEFSARKFG